MKTECVIIILLIIVAISLGCGLVIMKNNQDQTCDIGGHFKNIHPDGTNTITETLDAHTIAKNYRYYAENGYSLKCDNLIRRATICDIDPNNAACKCVNWENTSSYRIGVEEELLPLETYKELCQEKEIRCGDDYIDFAFMAGTDMFVRYTIANATTCIEAVLE